MRKKRLGYFAVTNEYLVSGVVCTLSLTHSDVARELGVNVAKAEAEEEEVAGALKAKHIVISSHVEHCLTFPQGG